VNDLQRIWIPGSAWEPTFATLLPRLPALAAAAILAAVGCADHPPPEASSDSLPPLVDLNGQPLRPFEQPGVKALATIFVLPDCPIANSYLPQINRLHEQFAPQGVEFVLVHADPATTAEQARKHVEDYGIGLPMIVDSDHAWVRRAGATRTPEAVVFSPRGEILYRGRIDDRYVGLGQKRPQPTTHDLQDALVAMVAGQGVKVPRTEAVGCYIPELPKGK
jgi:hypothetical protein